MKWRFVWIPGLVFFSAATYAQQLDSAAEVDREAGETEQIEQRQRWFVETRALDRNPDAAQLRSRAMQELRAELALLPPALLSVANRWESLGPNAMTMLTWTMGLVAGRTTSLGVKPGDDRVLYLATAAGGLWKSTNAGANWQRLSDSLNTPSIGAVQVYTGASPTADVVWVGTGEPWAGGCYGYFGQGLFRSDDGGLTFVPRNGSGATELKLSFINAIARHPTVHQTLLVGGAGQCNNGSGSGSGVWRTTDGGQTWTRVISVATSLDVLFDPGDGNVAYAAVNSGGVYKSTDAGATWAPLGGGLPTGSAAASVRVALADSDSKTLYALAGSPVGLYKSVDAGVIWQQTNAAACEGQCSYNLALDIHPQDPSKVLVGTIRPALSLNSGTTLTPMTSTWGSQQKVHQDIHVVRFSRNSPTRLWVGSDGGLWRSDDSGGNFSNLNAGLRITQFYDIALDPANPERVYGGAQDNSSEVRNGNDVWNVTLVTGDGFMNAAEPGVGTDNGKRVYQTSYPSGGTPSIYRSSSYGAPSTFSGLADTGIVSGEPFPWVTPLVVAPGNLFVGSNYVYRGATSQTSSAWVWTKISPNLSASTTSSIRVVSLTSGGTAPLRAYAGTANGKVWRCDDALAASPVWTEISAGFPGGNVTDIALTPGNSDVLYVTRSVFGSAQLYKSINAGGAWLPMASGLPNVPANSVVVDTENAQRIFVGTDIGVYESLNGGLNFSPLMLDMPPGTVVSDLEIAASPHVLVAGTYGSGAWRYELPSGNDIIFRNGFQP